VQKLKSSIALFIRTLTKKRRKLSKNFKSKSLLNQVFDIREISQLSRNKYT